MQLPSVFRRVMNRRLLKTSRALCRRPPSRRHKNNGNIIENKKGNSEQKPQVGRSGIFCC